MLFLPQCENPRRWFWKITKSSNSFPLVNKNKTCQNSPKQWVQSNNHSFICSLLKLVSLGVPRVLYYRCPYIEVSKTLVKISIEKSRTYKREGLNLRSWFFYKAFQNSTGCAWWNKLDILVSLELLWIYGTFSTSTAFLRIWKHLFHLPCQWSYLFTFLIPGLLEKLSHGTLWPEKKLLSAKSHRTAATSVEIM